MAVDRNPFYPKNFLTVSFSNAKSDVLGEFHLSRLETRLAKSGARTWGAVPSCGWSLPRCADIYLDYDDYDYSGLKWWFWWLFWSKARLTDGCWSPTKISLFFTTRTDGFVEVGGNMKNWVERKSNNIKVLDTRNFHQRSLNLIVGTHIKYTHFKLTNTPKLHKI